MEESLGQIDEHISNDVSQIPKLKEIRIPNKVDVTAGSYWQTLISCCKIRRQIMKESLFQTSPATLFIVLASTWAGPTRVKRIEAHTPLGTTVWFEPLHKKGGQISARLAETGKRAVRYLGVVPVCGAGVGVSAALRWLRRLMIRRAA